MRWIAALTTVTSWLLATIAPAQGAQGRMAVFEAFMRTT